MNYTEHVKSNAKTCIREVPRSNLGLDTDYRD
jgi:hypothetical protein